MSRRAAALTGTALLAIGPVALAWGFSYFEHFSSWHSGFAELVVLVASVTVGVVGVWLLPIKRLFRALLTIPYAAAMGWATLFGAFALVCAFFGDCL